VCVCDTFGGTREGIILFSEIAYDISSPQSVGVQSGSRNKGNNLDWLKTGLVRVCHLSSSLRDKIRPGWEIKPGSQSQVEPRVRGEGSKGESQAGGLGLGEE